jgi:hypothetical protein
MSEYETSPADAAETYIYNLERQIAEAQAEIERMRSIVAGYEAKEKP